MPDPSSIVLYDAEIARVLASEQGRAASELFERYRIAGHGRDTFVAALIGRLCVQHARSATAAAEHE
jgi:hypothetical protein